MAIRILVIDDDAAVLHTVAAVLIQGGFEVFTAENGRHGMRAFQGNPPDLVITDIIMPDQEGIETIIRMRQMRPKARIIAMSGGGRIESVDFLHVARRLGANHVLEKPFTPDELFDAINTVLGP